MKKFNEVNGAIKWLESQTKFREKTNLDIINKAYNKLNLKMDNIKKIHVGGTNGKGSTSTFITNVLVNENIKVGTFTSPYLIQFNERIKINNKDINSLDLLNLVNEIYLFNEQLFETENIKLSFFELLTLIALKHFSNENVDVIVMEIGIGGRLDATNILNYDATVITSIGFDHQNVLGKTLKEIATEKLGALKRNGLLIANPNNKLLKTFNQVVESTNSKAIYLNSNNIKIIKNNNFKYKDLIFNLKMQGSFQITNAILAYLTIKELFNIDDNKIIQSINNTTFSGRLEEILPNVYIDGAHNISAIKALNETIDNNFNNPIILFSALKDKDIKSMLKVFKNKTVILTSFPDPRFKSLESFENKRRVYLEDAIKVLNKLTDENKSREIIITGSLHFIGYIKKQILNNSIK